jgi:radical SAM superfamily enzyme YgiQ (UPF0313 family)
MSVAGASAPSATLGVSQALVIALRPAGLSIPAYRDNPEFTVDLPGLEVIEQLAKGLSPDPGETWDAIRPVLEARALLLSDGSPAPAVDLIGAGRPRATPEGAPRASQALPDNLVLPTPLLISCGPDGFEFVDHDGGVRATLSATELSAASEFRSPATVDAAWSAHQALAGPAALTQHQFTDLVEALAEAQVLVAFDPNDPIHARLTRQAERMRTSLQRRARVLESFDQLEEACDASSPAGRIPVMGIHTSWSSLPASLGMVIAAAKAYQGGVLDEAYSFRPRLCWDLPRLEAAAHGPPGIFLFSNYVWSSELNLSHSALVKQINPHHLTVHGGPDTPKYAGDVERYFELNPHVDIAVHGEGEATFAAVLAALRDGLGPGAPDLSVLAEVEGLSFRLDGQVVTTAGRDRVADLDSLPSPMLTGLYDGFIAAGKGPGGYNLETNRGCPYGCTFCDWGSATLSRVRKFDLDRVFAELEWCATNGFKIAIADANFGIFERDVDIAERIADLKAVHGYPRFVGNNYAKNTVKHLSKIIDIFTQAGIVAEGKMSMQSFDDDTLLTIRRKNIKVDKYDDLAVQFRRNQLPMSVDLMMGLPGSTPEAFRGDLQSCIDRDLRSIVHATVLLPNSPMNEPDYRRENGIKAQPGEEVRETATFSRDEWEHMSHLRSGFWIFENFGVLRQVATFVHGETGGREVDFYDRLVDAVVAEPTRWPLMAVTLQVLPQMMVPPVSWRRFIDEVHRYLLEHEGLADDSALATVLAVQHALLPARDRTFPVTVPVDHDYAAWHAAVCAARDAGHYRDWHQQVPRLHEFGSALFSVDDPLDSCQYSLGPPFTLLAEDSAWDLASPVSRPRQAVGKAEGDGDR